MSDSLFLRDTSLLFDATVHCVIANVLSLSYHGMQGHELLHCVFACIRYSRRLGDNASETTAQGNRMVYWRIMPAHNTYVRITSAARCCDCSYPIVTCFTCPNDAFTSTLLEEMTPVMYLQ